MTIPTDVDTVRCRWCRVYRDQYHRLYCPATLRRSWWVVALFVAGGLSLAYGATRAAGVRIRLSIPLPPLPWLTAGLLALTVVLLVVVLVLMVKGRRAQARLYAAYAERFTSIEDWAAQHDDQLATLTQRIDLGVKRHRDHLAEHEALWSGIPRRTR